MEKFKKANEYIAVLSGRRDNSYNEEENESLLEEALGAFPVGWRPLISDMPMYAKVGLGGPGVEVMMACVQRAGDDGNFDDDSEDKSVHKYVFEAANAF